MEVEEYNTSSEQQQLEIEHVFVERHREALEAQDQLAAVIRTANNMELAAERRRIERDAAAAQTSRERQLIDSIGLRRPQGHSVSSETLQTATISVNHDHPSTRRTGSRDLDGSTDPQIRSTASIYDFVRPREASRLDDQPRRRNSVVMPNSDSNAEPPSPHSSSLTASAGISVPSTSPSRLSAGTNDTLTSNNLFNRADPWQTISDAMSTANIPPNTLRNLQSRNLERRVQAAAVQQASLDRIREQIMAEHADALGARGNRARDNARSLRQIRTVHGRADVGYDGVDQELLLRRYPESPGRDEGLITMGIGWDEDGRNL